MKFNTFQVFIDYLYIVNVFSDSLPIFTYFFVIALQVFLHIIAISSLLDI